MKKLITLPVIVLHLFVAFSQNVGIGTTTPTAQLHTTGSVRHAIFSGNSIRPVFADANGNLLTTLPSPPSSSATNNNSQAIPDISCTGVSSANNLAGLPTAVQSSSIRVTISITHPKISDLSIYLTAPGGSIINLTAPSAALPGANFSNTVFTDEGVLLTSGSAPFTGSFKPLANMTPSICGIAPTVATFAAIGGGTFNPNGGWSLKVIDNTASNTGTLNSWSVSVVSGLGIDGVWGLKGNAGTNAYNFIGTTDKQALRFKVDNVLSGLIDTSANTLFGHNSGNMSIKGTNNTGIGEAALSALTTGESNTASGAGALASNTTGGFNTATGTAAMVLNNSGYGNTAVGNFALFYNSNGNNSTAIGNNALYNNHQNDIVAVGESAMFNNNGGLLNTAVGTWALYANKEGSHNTAQGFHALEANINGNFNTAIGTRALNNNITGTVNTAVGSYSLLKNTSGFGNSAFGSDALHEDTSGNFNSAFGLAALYANTTGFGNTATGYNSLVQNTTGLSNTASGIESLFANTTGSGNVAVGAHTLQFSTNMEHLVAIGDSALHYNGKNAVDAFDGWDNTAVGSKSLLHNTTGPANTAVGSLSLLSNTIGFFNTAIGDAALLANVSGGNNVAVGLNALAGNVSGNNNIAIGRNSDVQGNSLNNAIAIGYFATVNASNKVRLGNTSVTVIEGQVPFTSPSDGRFKTNVTETVIGLDFITKLRPVVYNFQTKKYDDFIRQDMPKNSAQFAASQDFSESEHMRQSGFLAQEVEKAAKEAGYDFNGIIIPKNEKQTYSLSYSQFVVPLVKAVQEQQAMIEEQNKKLVSMQADIDMLKAALLKK